MSKEYFQFKQFKVYHDKCAMKVGTDGVLLGTLTEIGNAKQILDIGTGTGLIALILAQRSNASIDAVEIDDEAANQAKNNFDISPWGNRLQCIHSSIFDLATNKQYDVIVSNPPYFINSLKSEGKKKEVARHVDDEFFLQLCKKIESLLTADGLCWIILPVNEMQHFTNEALKTGFYPYKTIEIHSFDHSGVKRIIRSFSKAMKEPKLEKFVIYDAPGKHSEQYKAVAKEFLTIF
ncbi:tRNA (adenosine(37)-N6)-methyltransferase TrmM [Solitalea longa]|uniref:tRNA1(Val) (adenine(37)-N6)-methyltransferase n=1 Tax=Solitalea longa TaxID=2079460 RepID=A0A2S5A0U2_9SPHI|nr:methyltransferase [Solitalea longa]POY36210.1 tRNA (adenosine(37)-N6)-methyltransferase TrmM [Solitalea longa]